VIELPGLTDKVIAIQGFTLIVELARKQSNKMASFDQYGMSGSFLLQSHLPSSPKDMVF